MSYARFIIAFLFGVCLGLVFPFLASWWLLPVIIIVLVTNELIGQWGFGSHWAGYRFSSYLLYTGTALCVIAGILLGSGDFGTLLIALGKLISR